MKGYFIAKNSYVLEVNFNIWHFLRNHWHAQLFCLLDQIICRLLFFMHSTIYKFSPAHYSMVISSLWDQLTNYEGTWLTRAYPKWYCARPGATSISQGNQVSFELCWNFRQIFRIFQCYILFHCIVAGLKLRPG